MTDRDPLPRAALYVDFDNVFMALLRWDERAAYAFGERPDAWLAWLEGREEGGKPATRRTLVRRCYLNPGGYWDFQAGRPVARYRATKDLRNRTYFSEFRAAFVQAGFDVVDCPPVAWLKNSADMKMALDIREALDHRTRFEEFVLLSGDSDFLPALARLRAHDRRITILAQDTAKAAYLAAADLVVGLDELAHEGMGNLPIAQFPTTAPARVEVPRSEPARPDLPALRAQALEWVRDAVARSPGGALRLTDIGQALPRAFPALRSTDYAGAGSLGALIEEAQDRRLSLSGPPARRWVFDAERGAAPEDIPAEEKPGEAVDAPEEAPASAEAPQAEAPALAAPEAETPEAEAPQPDPVGVSDTALMEAPQLLRDLLWGSRDPKGLPHDLPAFTPAELGFLLQAVVAAMPLEPASAAPDIARAAGAEGLQVSAREVTALLRWLMRGYVKLHEPATPEGAARLSRVLFATLVNTARAAGEKLSETETEALRAWTQSGLG
ncbi:NYN domain-containing protein [Falsiroseomonas sp.]|uniref:NYN domain-containing protein n=1 Tax=Falsiroseomonas sp. TaxID=2870721 RepID=UPI00271AF7D7|nr:NYN domain-containing protein [Falsiroseomonas sp.]MDO9498735.1 NYN domain-containing protein [Falsiroseomonas sp.]MDP3419002.1 NYN domain-containing protein [Falsiroseomonas sp.]